MRFPSGTLLRVPTHFDKNVLRTLVGVVGRTMLTLPWLVRVFLAPGATDMRKQFDGLAALTSSVIQQDPLSGHLFGFCNRRRDRIEIMFWDGSGYWVPSTECPCA